MNQQPQKLRKQTEDGQPLFEYKAAYSLQLSGRVTEIGGGFQGASRVFKERFFSKVPGIYNYDLSNSQAVILLHELEYCNLDTTWLNDYLSDPDNKVKYAKKVGIPTDIWKTCFYAMIMGAEPENKFGTIFKTLAKHFVQESNKAELAHQKFLKVVRGLITVTAKWRDYIYSSPDKRYSYQHNQVKYWQNACGMRFKLFGLITENGNKTLKDMTTNSLVKSVRKINKVKRRLAAFMLQGQEAHFIHHLTILCSNNNIDVYKNEYDGLITSSKIPEKLIEKARKKTNLKFMDIREKELCPKSKFEETKNSLKARFIRFKT